MYRGPGVGLYVVERILFLLLLNFSAWVLLSKTYRDDIYFLFDLISRNQARPDRTVRLNQEEISRNHVQGINLVSVQAF